ncbi:MAG: rhodanese-like domain-containing protein [Saprospiraceae bacterium]
MHIEQIYTGCLAQGAYYIRSGKEAVIIDPLREVQPYLDRAAADGVTIKYVFETHFHADFVSGHVTLSRATGAPIVYGPKANPTFDAIIATDGQEFKVGNITIVALHTPGHTMESTTYLLRDAEGKDHAIFSGDTLFLGDVGRPDLAQKVGTLTIEDLAGFLFDSLRTKIMPLADEVLVYPAHGAGSACGKNMSSETVGTLGGQKVGNYALRQNMTKEEFIAEVTDGLLAPPSYFPANVKLNREGYEDIGAVLNRGTRALSPDELETVVNETGALVLDVRGREEFAAAHIPRSIFIGIDGGFAPWVGALVKDVHQPIILVVEPSRKEEVITRLARVGFDQTLGYLKGGFEAWEKSGKETDQVAILEADQVPEVLAKAETILDVRKPTEWENGHVSGAKNTPLSDLNAYLKDFPKDQPFHVHCQSGYRSMIASSILKSRGFHNFKDVRGGWKAISGVLA